jgi:integrase
VAFGTGLRPSEQIGLKQERIDWDRNVVEIREGWRAGQRTRLKTAAANREVDILPAVRRALEEQRRIAGASELVFPNRFGSPINLHNLRARVWYPTLAKASLRRRDLYNTRHTFATHALASGEDPGWVAKMLGAHDVDHADDALLPVCAEPRAAGWGAPRQAARGAGKPVAKRWQPLGGLANRPVSIG